MRHERARQIFEEIRNEPYRVSTAPDIEVPNCYFKGIRLIKELEQIGYAVRGKVAEMDWRVSPLPQEIIDLRPNDYQEEQHFYVEVEIDGEWRVIDPSIDPASAALGFRMVEFEGDPQTCFHLTREFSQEEQIAIFEKMARPAFIEAHFQKNEAFLTAVNAWLDKNRLFS